jgi:hypothetical protein
LPNAIFRRQTPFCKPERRIQFLAQRGRRMQDPRTDFALMLCSSAFIQHNNGGSRKIHLVARRASTQISGVVSSIRGTATSAFSCRKSEVCTSSAWWTWTSGGTADTAEQDMSLCAAGVLCRWPNALRNCMRSPLLPTLD